MPIDSYFMGLPSIYPPFILMARTLQHERQSSCGSFAPPPLAPRRDLALRADCRVSLSWRRHLGLKKSEETMENLLNHDFPYLQICSPLKLPLGDVFFVISRTFLLPLKFED